MTEDHSHNKQEHHLETGNEPEPVDEQDTLTVWQVITSVLAAGFGVQSSENRKRDFSKGNPVTVILAGLIFTALFVLTIVGIVYLVL